MCESEPPARELGVYKCPVHAMRRPRSQRFATLGTRAHGTQLRVTLTGPVPDFSQIFPGREVDCFGLFRLALRRQFWT
jgi:hypothetical protein